MSDDGRTFLDRGYDFLMGEHEGRACEAIPESACTNVPRNFFLNVFNGASTKLAEQIASPGLVLPWFLSALGAPAFMAGWLVPLKQAGSMTPQLAVAGSIRGFERRKWFWVGAGITQTVALLMIILAALTFDGVTAGWITLVMMALFSVASGVGSVAFSDVVGKTIPKRRRGRLLGLRATLGGMLTVGAGLALRLLVKGTEDIGPYLVLIGIAAVLWFLAALLFGSIQEEKGATQGGRNAIKEAGYGLQLLKKNPGFGHFLLSRALLLLGVELALPYYALHAKQLLGGTLQDLGVFVVVSGVAMFLSSSIWGAFSDRTSRKTLIVAGVLAAFTALLALGIDRLPDQWHTALVYSPVVFLVGVAVAGVRTGRKTYIVDAAPDEDRPTYVAFQNTFSGLVTILGGFMSFVVGLLGIQAMLLVLLALGLLGALASIRMPEAEEMVSAES